MPSPVRTTTKGNVTSIDFKGPFFEKDPTKTFAENLDMMLRAMSKEAAADVRAQIQSHRGQMPFSRGRNGSISRVAERVDHPWRRGVGYSLIWTSTEGLQGRGGNRASGHSQWAGNEAAKTLAAMSSIEGRWHPFRVTKNRIMRMRSVNAEELTKGLE